MFAEMYDTVSNAVCIETGWPWAIGSKYTKGGLSYAAFEKEETGSCSMLSYRRWSILCCMYVKYVKLSSKRHLHSLIAWLAGSPDLENIEQLLRYHSLKMSDEFGEI